MFRQYPKKPNTRPKEVKTVSRAKALAELEKVIDQAIEDCMKANEPFIRERMKEDGEDEAEIEAAICLFREKIKLKQMKSAQDEVNTMVKEYKSSKSPS